MLINTNWLDLVWLHHWSHQQRSCSTSSRVSTEMGDRSRVHRLGTVFNQATQANSAFHLSGVGKASTGCLAGVKARRIHLCRVTGNTVISHWQLQGPLTFNLLTFMCILTEQAKTRQIFRFTIASSLPQRYAPLSVPSTSIITHRLTQST